MVTASLPFAFLMNQTPMELFHHGGPIMWPILIVSLVGLTVVVERIIFLIRENSTREPEVVEKMLERVENRDIEGAIELGKRSKDFVARILTYALTHKDQSLHNAFVRASNNELKRFQQGVAVLDTVITSAPLLGLLGTVTGVAEALIATAAGLAIAIIGLVPYNILNSQAEQAKHDIADASNALELIIKKSEGTVA